MVEGRICACPEDMYFDKFYDGEHYWTMKCLPLPKTFYKLKLDIKYTYNGKTHVQHHQLVTKDQCVSGSIYYPSVRIDGYMT